MPFQNISEMEQNTQRFLGERKNPITIWNNWIIRENMASYVSPAVRDKFESLSINLKNVILERNVQINDVYDLIDVLESIVKEEEQ